MSVTLRRLRWWDLAVVVPLERELFEDAWTAEMFWSELAQHETRHFVVAEDDREIVGYAGVAIYPEEGGYVQTIAVVPDVQRRGVGTLLLADLVRTAVERGATRVALEVRVDNVAAHGLYRRFGFAPVGLRRGYYQPSGTDALVMVADDVHTEEYAKRLVALGDAHQVQAPR